jgi:hypothetical protein
MGHVVSALVSRRGGTGQWGHENCLTVGNSLWEVSSRSAVRTLGVHVVTTTER